MNLRLVGTFAVAACATAVIMQASPSWAKYTRHTSMECSLGSGSAVSDDGNGIATNDFVNFFCPYGDDDLFDHSTVTTLNVYMENEAGIDGQLSALACVTFLTSTGFDCGSPATSTSANGQQTVAVTDLSKWSSSSVVCFVLVEMVSTSAGAVTYKGFKTTDT